MNMFITDIAGNTVATLDNSPIVVEERTPLLSAKVTEKINELPELEFTTLTTGHQVSEIMEGRKVILQNTDGSFSEFIIDKIEDTDGEFPVREVFAVGSAIELKDELILNEINFSTSPSNQLTDILRGTDWSTGYVDPSIYSQAIKESVKHLSVLEALFILRKDLNCDIRFTYKVVGNTISHRQVDLFKTLGSNKGKRFEVGKDISEVKRTVDTSEIKTAILPMGTDGKQDEDGNDLPPIDISSISWSKANGDPIDKPKGQKVLGDPEALKTWGIRRKTGKMAHRLLFMEMDVDSPAQLISLAWMQLGRYNKPKVTYEAKIVDLYRLSDRNPDFKHEEVILGDSVLVKDANFPQPIKTSARVVEIVKDLLEPENDEVVIGEAKSSYSSRQVSQEQSLSEAQQSAKQAALDAGKALVSANSKNANYHGTEEPKNPIKDDLWFRPHPDKPEEDQMLVFDGVQWQVVLDTSEITEDFQNMEKEIKEAKEKADKASVSSQESLDIAIEAQKGLAQAEEDAKKAVTQSLGAKEEAKKALANADKALTQAQSAKEGTDSLKLTVDSIGKEVALKATKSEVDNVRGTVQEQATKIAQNSKEISAKANQSEVNTLKGTVKEQETKIALNAQGLASKANQSDIDTLNKTVKEQETKLTQTAKEVEVKASKSEVKKVADELQGLEFGGTNLFIGTSNKLKKIVIDGWNHYPNSPSYTIEVEEGQKYSAQAYIKSITSNVGVGLRFFWYSKDNKLIRENSSQETPWVNSGKSGYFVIVDTAPSGATGLRVALRNSSGTGKSTIEYKELKVEKGNRPTDWSPAPEDMATDADVKNVEASLKVQSEEIALKASKSEVKLVSDELKNLEFGARNHIRNTSSSYKTLEIKQWHSAVGNRVNFTDVGLKKGDSVTARVYLKVPASEKYGANIRVNLWKKDGTYTVEAGNTILPSKEGYSTLTVKVPDINIYNQISLSIDRQGAGNNEQITIQYKELKLEKGNKPTDWSPAPEDLAQEADVKKMEASLKVQSDAINLKANKTELDATNKKVSANTASLGVQAEEIKGLVTKSNKTSTDLAQVKVTADRVSTQVANIRIGGDNLIKNSKGAFMLAPKNSGNASDNFNYQQFHSDRMEMGVEYTFSAKVSVTHGKFDAVTLYAYPSGEQKLVKIGKDGLVSFTFTKTSEDTKFVLVYAGESGKTRGNGLKIEEAILQKGNTSTEWTPSFDDYATSSSVTQLADNINARIVEKDKIISQINLSKETILIQGKNIHLDGNTKINNGVIKNAHIQDAAITNAKILNFDAGKATTGYLHSDRIKARSITASKLTSDSVQVGFNAIGKTIQITQSSLNYFSGSTLKGRITSYGSEYWDGGAKIGTIGSTHKAGSTATKGLRMNIEDGGKFITWSYTAKSGDNPTAMLTFDPYGSFTGRKGLQIASNIVVNGAATKTLQFTTIKYQNYNYPALMEDTGKSGIVFGANILYLMQNGVIYNLGKLIN